jgi:hypothetical protein
MLAACVGERIGGPLIAEADAPNATSLLSNINEKAQKCWFKSGDRAFRGLAVIPELDTRVGSPRLLVVERGQATGLPKMVIEAEGNPVKITTYGPLTETSVSARINDDVLAWSAGRESC